MFIQKIKKKIAIVFIEILKQKRKFLIVKRGTGIQDILLKTYVIVEKFGKKCVDKNLRLICKVKTNEKP